MKKIYTLLILLILPLALAQDLTETQEGQLAGILPDSPLYQIDTFVDNLRLQLAGSDIDKAELRIKIMNERTYEYKLMLQKGKTTEANKANQLRQNELQEVEKLKLKLNEQEKLQVQEKLQNHEMVLEQVKLKFQEKQINTEGIETAIQNTNKIKENVCNGGCRL